MPTLASLRDEYTRTFAAAKIRPECAAAVKATARKILRYRARYEAVAAAVGVPWVVVGVLHARESDCDFTTHLHNGDPLTARTKHVPAGRPFFGEPPFDWEDSAADALEFDHIATIADRWDVPALCFAAETFNGFGYRRHGERSPYLWAGTTQQRPGKYTSDGYYDRAVMDRQPGVIALLIAILADVPDALPGAAVQPYPKSAPKPQLAPAPAQQAQPIPQPPAVTARDLAADGSRTMTTLLRMQTMFKALLGMLGGLFTLENLGLAKGYVDAIKNLASDHAALLIGGGVVGGFALALYASGTLVAAANDGRYATRAAAGGGEPEHAADAPA